MGWQPWWWDHQDLISFGHESPLWNWPYIAITHHFSTELTFNFQLHTYPLFKHWLPICPWISILQPTIIIEQPTLHSHQINMSNQDEPQVCIWGSLRLRDGRPCQIQMYLKCHSPFDNSSLFNMSSAPSCTSYWASTYSYVPTVVSQPTSNILPSLPSFLPTHYFLHTYDPRDHIIWERTSQKLEGNMLYQDRSKGSWPLLDHRHMEYTGVEFSNWVNWGLVIDPNPQDMLSWLDQVGSLMWLWWGHLSELVWWS